VSSLFTELIELLRVGGPLKSEFDRVDLLPLEPLLTGEEVFELPPGDGIVAGDGRGMSIRKFGGAMAFASRFVE
jgi:hypothetical protein